MTTETARKRATVPVRVWLDPESASALQQIAGEDDSSVSRFVRQLVKREIADRA